MRGKRLKNMAFLKALLRGQADLNPCWAGEFGGEGLRWTKL